MEQSKAETCANLSAILPQVKDSGTRQIVNFTLKKLNSYEVVDSLCCLLTKRDYNSIICNQLITFCKGDMTLICNRIKVLRAERNWTQEDLANKVGISRQAVISIEKYKYTPSLELAFRIAEAFQVSIDVVFEHTEKID